MTSRNIRETRRGITCSDSEIPTSYNRRYHPFRPPAPSNINLSHNEPPDSTDKPSEHHSTPTLPYVTPQSITPPEPYHHTRRPSVNRSIPDQPDHQAPPPPSAVSLRRSANTPALVRAEPCGRTWSHQQQMASTAPIRPSLASSSALTQRTTFLLTVCQSTQLAGDIGHRLAPPGSTACAAHRPARQVNNSRSEAIQGVLLGERTRTATVVGHTSWRSTTPAAAAARTPGGPPDLPTSPFDHTRTPGMTDETPRWCGPLPPAPRPGARPPPALPLPNPTITSRIRYMHTLQPGGLLLTTSISAPDYGGPHPDPADSLPLHPFSSSVPKSPTSAIVGSTSSLGSGTKVDCDADPVIHHHPDPRTTDGDRGSPTRFSAHQRRGRQRQDHHRTAPAQGTNRSPP